MSRYFCPVEGCPKSSHEWDEEDPPFPSEESLRGHLSGSTHVEGHKEALEEGLWRDPEVGEGVASDTSPEEEEETTPEGTPEEGSEGGGRGTSDEDDQPDDQNEGGETTPDDDTNMEDSVDPWDGSTDQPDDPDDHPEKGGNGDPSGSGQGTSGSSGGTSTTSGGGIPVPSGLYVIVAFGILSLLVYLVVIRGSDDQPEIDPDQGGPTTDEDDERETISRESGGGLSG